MSLSRAQKKRLHILPRDLIGYAIQLQREGIDLREVSEEEAVAILLGEAFDADPVAWGQPTELDLDGILQFITAILPLILQIIAIFS